MRHRRPPRASRRRREAALLGVATLALVAALVPNLATGGTKEAPDRLREFMWGMAGQESGWDYTARNRWSGAYGKYQIMPFNWPSWAGKYLGDRWAEQTPRHQELVARGKLSDLYRWLDSWRRVAYWWLTGKSDPDEDTWSESATRYVNNVMALSRRAPEGGDPLPKGPADGAPSAQRGDWRYVVTDTRLFDRVDDGRRVARVDAGKILFVQAVRWNHRDVLWLRASTSSGKVGWISIRKTVPAPRPDGARRWPRGKDVGDDDRRERARPRPR
jgi:hypothetical protein